MYTMWAVRTKYRYNLIHTAAHEGDFVTVVLLIKFFSISFQPKWPPLISFLNLCHSFMFLAPSCPPHPTTPPHLPALQHKKERMEGGACEWGREKSPNSQSPQQQQSDDLVSDSFCWVRNWGMGEVGEGGGGAGKREYGERRRGRERWHRDEAYSNRFRSCGLCCVIVIYMKPICVSWRAAADPETVLGNCVRGGGAWSVILESMSCSVCVRAARWISYVMRWPMTVNCDSKLS